MKKGGLLLLLVILLPTAYGLEEYSGWVHSCGEDTITLGETEFRPELSTSDFDILTVYWGPITEGPAKLTDIKSTKIQKGYCDTITSYKICYDTYLLSEQRSCQSKNIHIALPDVFIKITNNLTDSQEGSDNLYSGWLHSCKGNTFRAKDTNFWPELDPSNLRILYLSWNGTSTGSTIINYGECKLIGLLELCYKDYSFGYSDEKYCMDPRYSDPLPDVLVTVGEYSPNIKITRTVSTSSILPSEEFNVNLKISNDGYTKVTNAAYYEDIPLGYKLLYYNKGNVLGDKLKYFISSMNPGESIDLEYSLKSLYYPNSVETSGYLSYDFNSKNFNVTSPKTKFTTNDIITDKITLPSKSKLGESFEVPIEISSSTLNYNDLTYLINFSGLTVTSIDPSFTKLKEGIFKAKLSPITLKTFIFEVTVNSTKKGAVNVTHSYSSQGIISKGSKIGQTSIAYTTPKLTIKFEPNTTEFLPTAKVKYSTNIENPNNEANYKEVRCNVYDNATLESDMITVANFDYGSWMWKKDELEIPKVGNKTKYRMDFTCTFMISDKESINVNSSRVFYSAPLITNPDISIENIFKTNITKGEFLPVTIRIKNKYGRHITDMLVSSSHSGLAVKRGADTLKFKTLNDSASYEYTLYIPVDAENKTEIVTTADYFVEGVFQRVIKKSVLNIIPKTKKIAINDTLNVNDSDDPTNPKTLTTTISSTSTATSTVITTTTISANPNLGQRLMTNLEVFINSLFPKKLK